MKNLYAYCNDRLIHISEVIKESKEEYNCINCGDKLIARKGKINAHHFSHKSDSKCSYESYLHKLGKLIFYDVYNKCLKYDKPYYIEYKKQKFCNSCSTIKSINKTCDLGHQLEKFDLTTVFDEIYIEKNHEGFIADILLGSSKIKEVIFIEIAVTHQCDEQKIKSGNRIIEFDITNENSLQLLRKRNILSNNEEVTFINFKTRKEFSDFTDPLACNKLFSVFFVFESNKCVRLTIPMKSIIKKKSQAKYIKLINRKFEEEDSEEDIINFRNAAIEATFKVKGFKNCQACRFCVPNKNYELRLMYGNIIFCKKRKEVIKNSNQALDCKYYWKINRLNHL